MLALRYLDSNQEGRINSPLVYLLTDTGMKCRALPSLTGRGARRAFVAGLGFEPSASAYEADEVTELLQPAAAPRGVEPRSAT